MRQFSISTAIAYPNGQPHLGHALEFVIADFFAREARLRGELVYFQTGTDEHGRKVQLFAESKKMQPLEFVNSQAEYFMGVMQRLDLSYDRFIRTTDPDHYQVAQALWRRVAAKGLIEKRTYKAWYNVKEEEYAGPADQDPASFGVDPQFLELVEEENYFFKFSAMQKQILSLLESGEYKILPENRRLEMRNFAECGLHDFSISRQKTRLSWGIPVPDDDDQVMYVWFDALTNYLTGASSVRDGQLILNLDRWPWSLHIVGKDVARFHALMWPAILLAADLPVPKELIVHGFVLANGEKMSKSLGNGVSPEDLLTQFGSDATRWLLLARIQTLDDGNMTMERAHELYSSDLVNDLGNLVSRVTGMVKRYCAGITPLSASPNLEKVLVEEAWQQYDAAVAARQIDVALAQARGLVVFANRRIEEMKPWVLAKDESRRAELEELLYELLEIIRQVSIMILPAMPQKADQIRAAIAPYLSQSDWCSRSWGGLRGGLPIGTEAVLLFPRIESEATNAYVD